MVKEEEYFVHNSSVIDQPCVIGSGTRIWHFSHIMKDAVIGRNCNIGQNVFIDSGVIVGDGVKIQNNVSLYKGVVCEDDVFSRAFGGAYQCYKPSQSYPP